MPAVAAVDFNGTPIVMNQTVKLVGVVTGIDIFDTGYGEITVTLTHPLAVPDVIVAEGAETRPLVGGRKVIQVSPTMLVVGA